MNKLFTGALLALPLIVVGILSAHSWKLEIQTLQNVRIQLLKEQLQQTEIAGQQAIDKLIQEAVFTVESTLREDKRNAPRNLILTNNTVIFLVYYSNSQRIFPPEESNSILVSEKARLDMLSTALQVARNMLLESNHHQQSAFDIYLQSHTIMHCQHLADSQNQICLLLHPNKLLSHLKMALKTVNENNPDWVVKLSSAGDSFTETSVHRRHLPSPLQTYALQAQWSSPGKFTLSYLTGLLLILLPLLLSWLVLVWFFYQRQQTNLMTSTQRAVLTAQLSHELRTPLANLRLYTDLLKRKAMEPESMQHYSAILEEEISRLDKLTEQAIGAARGKTKHSHLLTESPDKIIQKLLDRFAGLWQQAACTINFYGQADMPLVFDQAALESILLQLLDNACKYASPGPIDIHTWLEHPFLYLQVRDYGPGLTAEELKNIFHPETRGNYHRDIQGFGLGLAAARYFAHLNKGYLTVVNTTPGLAFTATLSVRKPE